MTREEAKERVNYIDYMETAESDWIMESGVKQLLDKVYDDFESITCENCNNFTKIAGDKGVCYIMPLSPIFAMTVDCDFGCNKFEGKINNDS